MFTRFGHKSGNLFSAIALLIGTAVGAGIFGLPYVISKSGFFVGIVYIFSLGAVALIVNLAYGEVILSTNGTHQLPKYVEKYLGKRWKTIAIITTFLGFYGALTAYLVEVGNLLYAILSNSIGGTPLMYSLGFFVVMAAALFIGLRAVANFEKIIVVAIILMVILLAIVGMQHVTFDYYLTFDSSAMFLPYGVVLFAIGAGSAVPDMKNVLMKNQQDLKKAIIIGTLVPVVLYLIFVTMIVGITGPATTESAVLGLGTVINDRMAQFGAIFGVAAMSTSFLALGLVLKEIYIYDLKQRPILSWLLVLIPPFILVIFSLVSFIEVLGISGALLGGINGIIMMGMHRHIKNKRDRKPEYSISQSRLMHYIVYIIFVLGMFYEAYILLGKFNIL